MLQIRIKLLLILLPLAALWWLLSLHAPISRWNGLNPFKDGKRFCLYHHRFSNDKLWQTWAVLDIRERTYKVANNWMDASPPGNSAYSSNIAVISSDEKENKLRLELYSHAEKRVVRSIERSLPLDTQIRVIGSRFVIVDKTTEIQWLDLDDPNETWHTLTIPRGESAWVWAHPELPVFRRTAFKPTPPGSTQPPQSFTELYRFDEKGQLRELSNWINGHSGREGLFSTWFQDDTIVSLDSSGAFVEVRSLEDGKLIKRLKLEPQVDLLKQKFCVRYGYLEVEDAKGFRHYSLKHEKWLVPAFEAEGDWTTDSVELSPDSRLALWRSRSDQSAILTDHATDMQVCKLQEPGVRSAFLDRNTLISYDWGFLLTVRQHDLTTGETLLVWRPFWWVLPVFATACVGSVLWVRSWLMMKRPNMAWAWMDLHLLLFLLMALIVLRLKFAGDPLDTMRLPYQHAIYITAGSLLIAWAWVVFGKSSVVSRLSHLLLVYAIVLGSLSQALATETNTAWMGIALVSLPSLLALPLLVAARWRGWDLFTAQVEPTHPIVPAAEKTELITLRQVMIMTAIFALLSLAVRPIVPGIIGVLQLNWSIWQTVEVTFCGIVALLLATCKRSWLKRFGQLLAVVIPILFIVDGLVQMVCGIQWPQLDWWTQTTIRHCLGIYTTVFLLSTVLVSSAKMCGEQVANIEVQ